MLIAFHVFLFSKSFVNEVKLYDLGDQLTIPLHEMTSTRQATSASLHLTFPSIHWLLDVVNFKLLCNITEAFCKLRSSTSQYSLKYILVPPIFSNVYSVGIQCQLQKYIFRRV